MRFRCGWSAWDTRRVDSSAVRFGGVIVSLHRWGLFTEGGDTKIVARVNKKSNGWIRSRTRVALAGFDRLER